MPLRRVLIAHSSDEMYGADFILLRVAGALRRAGVEVHVIVPADIGGPRPLSAALREIGCRVDVHELAVLRRKYLSVRQLPGLTLKWLREVIRLHAMLRRERPDLLYSNTLAVTAPAIAASIAGVPHVWHVHEIVERPRWLGRLLAILARRLATRVVSVSVAVSQWLESAAPGMGSVVVRNGIPDPLQGKDREEERRRANVRLGIPDHVPLVLMIGRLSEWKGAAVFAQTALEHARDGGEAHFAIVGGTVPGEERVRDQLERIASAHVLQGRLHLIDFTSDIAMYLVRASVFVLPSVRPDPYPTVVLEAMYAGLPIVSFAHGGVLEMLHDSQAGMVVPVGDVSRLRIAIDTLIADRGLARELGDRGRAHAVREFEPSLFERRLLDQLTATAEASR